MSKYIESETLELKEKYTDKIAKEMVPFLDSGGENNFYWSKINKAFHRFGGKLLRK